MLLTAFLTATLISSVTVKALPPQYPSGYGPSPVSGGEKPGQSVAHQPWHRHVEVREAAPEPMPAAMPEALAEAAPHPVPDAEFVPTLIQRSPASEPDSYSKLPPSYGPGPVYGPVESVSHKAWKRALPDLHNEKRDTTELIDFQEHPLEARDENAADLEKREATPTSGKWPPGYSGFPVGPIESVSHKPWHRNVLRDAMPEAQPDPVSLLAGGTESEEPIGLTLQ